MTIRGFKVRCNIKVKFSLNSGIDFVYSFHMRLVIVTCFLCLGLGVSHDSLGQDVKAESQVSKKTISEETTQTETSKKTTDDTFDKKNESFDLDSFFKQGEENAKKDSNCEKTPEPVA